MHAPPEESLKNQQHQMNMVFANRSKEDMIYPLTVKEIALAQERDFATIGKWEYTPGTSYIPGTFQHSYWWSFVFFGWCICGICHIPTIHQPMSHLQKFAICVNIGSFVVMYARCTPGFGGVVGIC